MSYQHILHVQYATATKKEKALKEDPQGVKKKQKQ